MLIVVAILSLLGLPSLCHGNEELTVPIGSSIAQLGKALNLANLHYMPTQVVKSEGTTVPVASYRDGIVLVESTSDVSTLLGFSQPVTALVAMSDTNSMWSFTGPFIKSALSIPDDVIVLFAYAEKVKDKQVIPTDAVPMADWEDRNQGATHYVKEVLKGAQLGMYLEITPKNKDDYPKLKKKAKETIEKYAKKNKDAMYILKKVAKAMRRVVVSGCTMNVQGDVLGSSSCTQSVDNGIKYFSEFQDKETKDTLIKAVVRPLKDFNPTKDEYIMKYSPESFTAVLDKIQAMYVETKSVKEKVLNLEVNNAELQKLYSAVSMVVIAIGTAMHDLSFQKAPDQFASAVNTYGQHPMGYYERRYQQLTSEDTTKRGSIPVPDGTAPMEAVFEDGIKMLLPAAPSKGFYKISYTLKTTGAGKKVVKFFQGEKVIIDRRITCYHMCQEFEDVVSGSFIGILEQGDVIKAEVVGGRVGDGSRVSAVLVTEL